MSTHYESSTVAELIATTGSRTVLVRFPFNDYRTSRGVKAHSPVRHLKLLTDKAGAYVRFVGRKWDILKVDALVNTHDDGSTYRHLLVRTIQPRD